MQAITPVLSSGVASGKARGGENIKPLFGVRADSPAAAAAAPTAAGFAIPRGGLREWNPQLNQQFSGAQQALGFLDETAEQLQDIKRDLSSKLVTRDPQPGQLADKLQQFTRTWRERPTATAGRLSPRLGYSAEGSAPQRFTVRGLTLQSLQSGDKETLSFSVTGAGRGQPAVFIEPGLSDDALVQRFDQALAASHIRVRKGDAGSLVFSTPEAAWPGVRDSLAVRGGGIRFPTGQFNRVHADAEPEAVQPQGWRLGDAEAMRQTLGQVLQALDAVKQARAEVGNSLQAAGDALQAAQPPEPADGAAAFVRRFEAIGREHDFSSHASVAAALLGVRRDRVLSLLSLRG